MKSFLKYTLASMLGFFIIFILGTIFSFSLFFTILSMGEQPVEVKGKSVLTLNLNAQIVERAQENPWQDIDFGYAGFNPSSEIGLDQILESIEAAKDDERIRGIFLNLSQVRAGSGTLEEIRNALLDFKKSEKFIYAYGENLSQGAYYLVSAADKVALNPQGAIHISGLSGNVTFYKEALERLGVKMEVIRHGKFKSAVEPYLTNEMSPASRLQMQTFLNSIWREITHDIAESRNISPERFNQIADSTTMFCTADELLAYGLVDTLIYKDQVLEDLKELTGTRKGKDINAIGPKAYANAIETYSDGTSSDHIAVIYAAGGIDTGGGGIDSEEISKTIRLARKDSTIKAIVLRVNSPGGSAYGSEVMWREVDLTKEVKPIVVSMGDYAASGGYYMSCAASEIFAERTTITGSIGIYATIPEASELMRDKLGLTFDHVGTNAHSNMFSAGPLPALNRPLNDFERAGFQKSIENGYDTFITRVADGRNTTKPAIDKIGQGRVWAAKDAQEIGLVDSIGTLNDAIERAAKLAELDNYELKKLPAIKNPIEELLKDLSSEAKTYAIKQELGSNYRIYKELKQAMSQGGIMAKMPYELDIQ